MPDPLNPALYKLLDERFAPVRIANEGEAYIGGYEKDMFSLPGERQYKRVTTNPGEQYRICCPYCTDTRYRLYISHLYGVRDDHGSNNTGMLVCHNADCLDNPVYREDFLGRLTMLPGRLASARIKPGKRVIRAGEARLPGPHYQLDTLDQRHPANAYLTGGFHDTQSLGRFYHVGYCPSSQYYLARNRIIAPIFFLKKLVGWQARYIGELPWHDKKLKLPPKWWTMPGFHKATTLYNYDNAIRCCTGVVVEGPRDVWGTGPMGLATLGSSCSVMQGRYLVSGFKDHSLVWCWDPDVQKDEKKMAHLNNALKQLEGKFRHGLAVVWLPEGRDPGGSDRGWLHDYIAREARAQGVKVSWGWR